MYLIELALEVVHAWTLILGALFGAVVIVCAASIKACEKRREITAEERQKVCRQVALTALFAALLIALVW